MKYFFQPWTVKQLQKYIHTDTIVQYMSTMLLVPTAVLYERLCSS